MIQPKSNEELAQLIEKKGKTILFFTADWCPDCQYIYPAMPEIEADFSDYRFVRVDRDEFMDLAKEWDIFGIPSFIAIEDGKEIGRFANQYRKSKEEIKQFLGEL